MGVVVEAIRAIVLPAFNGLVKGFDLIRDAIERNSDKLEPFFTLIKAIAGFIVAYLAPAISQTLGVAFKVVGTIISTVIDQFSNFLATLTSIFNAIKRIIDFVQGAGNIVGNLLGFNNASNASFSTPGIVNAPFTPSAPRGGYSGQAVNITVNGAIDSESTARQIVNVLNQSSYRGTLGAGAFA
jgi:phage-related protein